MFQLDQLPDPRVVMNPEFVELSRFELTNLSVVSDNMSSEPPVVKMRYLHENVFSLYPIGGFLST